MWITHVLPNTLFPPIEFRYQRRIVRGNQRRRWWGRRNCTEGSKVNRWNSCAFDQKDLSRERSGTASVATTSPHAEFPDRRSGRLIRRSSDGGGTKAAIHGCQRRWKSMRWHQTPAPSTGKISQLRDQEPYLWQRRPHTRKIGDWWLTLLFLWWRFFRSQERGGWRSEEEEVCPNSKGLSVAKRSSNFLMSA
jgi:hypothetical protein